MKLFRRTSSRAAVGAADFDMLRAGLEVEIARPAVVAITSSTAEDGAEIAACGLARALANAGYPTLLVDTSRTNRSRMKPAVGVTLEEIGRQVDPNSGTGNLAVANLSDVMLQNTTSQRCIQSALEVFRGKFDYVVISTEHGVSTPFATSVVVAADVVLVTVKTGRREKKVDGRLADALKRLGVRYLGVLALDSSLTNADSTMLAELATIKDPRRNQSAHLERDFARREMAEWPT